MVRASRVLNRQWLVALATLRSVTKAWTSRWRASWSGSRCFKQERDSTLNSISAIPSASSGQGPANCRAWGCSGTPAFLQSAGPWRWKGLVQRRRAVGVQIIQHHSHHSRHRDPRVGFVHQPAHPVGEVLHGAPLGHATCRQPAKGSQARNRLRVPSRRYS